MANAVEIKDLSKKYRLYSGKKYRTVKDLFVRGIFKRGTKGLSGLIDSFWALTDINLDVPEGKMLGIIGSNGSGKSTLLKIVAGILKPTKGVVLTKGRISALIELGAGFHPEFSGRENIFINGIVLGLSKKEIKERFDDIVSFAGLEDFIDNPVKTYSSGMYMRLGFSIAVSVEPDILLIDEILAVGDEAFQHKCVSRINDFKRQGKTILFVSHDLGVVERLCDEVAWLDDGVLKSHGQGRMVVDQYLEHVSQEEEKAYAEEQKVRNREAGVDSSRRWGSKEVEIYSVKLLDKGGKERYVYEPGESAVIELRYLARKRISDPVFGIGIFRSDGICCYGSNTAIDGLSIPYVEGEGAIKVYLNSIDLIEGDYYLDVATHDRNGYPYDYHSRLYTFAVRSRIKDVGISRIKHTWDIK